MNLDERIGILLDECIERFPLPNDYEVLVQGTVQDGVQVKQVDRAKREIKQLIREVIVKVTPERLDRRGLSDEDIKKAVWYDQAINEMEAKTKELLGE